MYESKINNVHEWTKMMLLHFKYCTNNIYEKIVTLEIINL